MKVKQTGKYKCAQPKTILEQKLIDVEKQDKEKLKDAYITEALKDNLSSLKGIFKGCYDFSIREVQKPEEQLTYAICYIDGMVDSTVVNEMVMKSLNHICFGAAKDTQSRLNIMKNNLSSSGEPKLVSCLADIVSELLNSSCIVLIDGHSEAISIYMEGTKTRSITEPTVEAVVKGPLEAFTESGFTSVTQIRRRLKTHKLKTEYLKLGKESKTRIVVAYIEGIADRKVVREVKRRLSAIDTDIILATGQVQAYIEDDYLSPFPQTELTERPDSGVAALVEGRVLIIVDGTPFILMVPTTITYFFTSADDYYNRYIFASFIRVLRYLALFVSIFGPSLYVAITTFHAEMIPTMLLMTIANARAEVPFPAFIEAMLMELVFEVIREAGARQPKTLGQALNIVGALVIGQLSVQAGLVSPAMIIVVAVTGLASFLIPKINTSREVSLIRFPMLILGGVLGIFGITLGVLVMLIHLVSLRSFGVPYMSPITPINLKGMKDAIIKFPEYMLTRRPDFIQKNNLTRRKEKDENNIR